MEGLLKTCNDAKKQADLLFVKGEFQKAIDAYTAVLKQLAPIGGFNVSDMLTLRSWANIAACHLKLQNYKEVVNACNKAILSPSAVRESNLLSKVYERQALALEELKEYEPALIALDRCIAIELCQRIPPETTHATAEATSPAAAATSPYPHEQHRKKLCNLVLENRPTFVALPPAPQVVTSQQISAVIKAILSCKCDPTNKNMMMELQKLTETRGFLDKLDDKGCGLMWAVCQCAMIRAARMEVVFDGDKDLPAFDSLSSEEQDIKKAKAEADADPDAIFPVLQVLVGAGCSVTQRGPDAGKACVQLLCMAGATKCVSVFLAMDANPNVMDDQGWGALHCACAVNSPAARKNQVIVDMLCQKGCFPNHQTMGQGLSALHLAAQTGDGQTVLLLLKKGASINMRCRLGFSPIVYALIGTEGSDGEACQVLMSAAAAHVKIVKEQKNEDSMLLKEIEQDRQCYAFSRHVRLISKLANTKVQTEMTAEEVSKLCCIGMLGAMRIPADLVDFGLMTMTTATVPTSPASEAKEAQKEISDHVSNMDEAVAEEPAKPEMESNPLFMAYIQWDMISPYICRAKKWLPVPSEEEAAKNDYSKAFKAAPALEQMWCNILAYAIDGMSNSSLPALVLAGTDAETEPYCVPRIMDDFNTYCKIPLCINFCSAVPSPPALEALLALGAGSVIDLAPISIGGKDGFDANGDARLVRIKDYWNKVLASIVAKSKDTTAAKKAATAGAAVRVPLLRLYARGDDHTGPNKIFHHAVHSAMTLNESESVVLLCDDIDENARRSELIETLCNSLSLKEKVRIDLPQWPLDVKTTFILLSK